MLRLTLTPGDYFTINGKIVSCTGWRVSALWWQWRPPRIRDTDVAEEMMSYVENNILVQSAQAMLAQANQLLG